ncbi:Plasmid stabilization system [Crenothrix polyspora]|uniref:Plasmid stabilization system n=1 Tax=Crenothrix polyspora TaxID=360316 RepID=A0A1R4H964_9GAMM|nr:type II toxin-antitoxin system RelE/ParE family toxin [Crenothrix polyspora]SJM92804.1 Plasmid stabilization system [Crenothrix polyspora]
MRLRWSERSINDLIAIQRHIAQNNPVTAKKWIIKIRQRAKSAADSALIGRVVPEFNQQDIREVFLGNYRIVYRVRDDDILILTVFEGHQLLKL